MPDIRWDVVPLLVLVAVLLAVLLVLTVPPLVRARGEGEVPDER